MNDSAKPEPATSEPKAGEPTSAASPASEEVPGPAPKPEALPEQEGVSDEETEYRAELVEKFCAAANIHLACEGYANPQSRAIVKAIVLAMMDTRQ